MTQDIEQKKDLSLLRPFDLEAAKAGELVLQQGGNIFKVRWVARSGNGLSNIVEGPGMHAGLMSRVDYVKDEHLRMAPLCWIEGKPVYKGDKLYQYEYDLKDAVTRVADKVFVEANKSYLGFNDDTYYSLDGTASKLTWNKPKVKKEGWINIYESDGDRMIAFTSHAYPSESVANDNRGDEASPFSPFIKCIRIEWEE